MEESKLHPSIQEFKQFIQSHPKIIKSVRDGRNTWQELYEDWYLLGEDDPKWSSFKSEHSEETNSNQAKSKQWFEQIPGFIKNMDADQFQKHVRQLSQTIGAIQGVLQNIQPVDQSGSKTAAPAPQHPFSFKKD